MLISQQSLPSFSRLQSTFTSAFEHCAKYYIEREIIPSFQPGASVKCGARKQSTGTASEQIIRPVIAA